MTLRLLNTSLLALGIAGGAFAAIGCGQGEISEPQGATDTAVEEALSAVRGCQEEARSCVADATGVTCEDQLKACLSDARAARADAGRRPEREAGAGHEDDRDRDAEAPSRPERDGAVARDGDTPRPNPLDVEGGASLIDACVEDLRACLASTARPSTCATGAIGCLSALVHTHKH